MVEIAQDGNGNSEQDGLALGKTDDDFTSEENIVAHLNAFCSAVKSDFGSTRGRLYNQGDAAEEPLRNGVA